MNAPIEAHTCISNGGKIHKIVLISGRNAPPAPIYDTSACAYMRGIRVLPSKILIVAAYAYRTKTMRRVELSPVPCYA